MRSILGLLVAVLICEQNLCEDLSKETINVRTVLFKDIDVCKPVWSMEDIDLLVARKIMQDILPRKLPSNFNNLIAYFKKCIEIIRKKAPPDESPLLTLALYDVLGGYLKAVAIPILNEAYYAGNVNYMTAAEIHSLYGRIMAYLRTDGGGWAQPCDMRKIPTKVQALQVVLANTSDACSELEIRPPQNDIICTGSGKEPSRICIPYLDDNAYPNAVAIPLKGNSLFSLMSNCSSNLLPKFYILSMRCLSTDCFTKKDIINFNHQFYEWIISTVLPHIHETDRWYPGFGGVMRIVETMNQKGLVISDSNLRPDTSPSKADVPGNFDEMDNGEVEQPPCTRKSSTKFVLILIILIVLFILLCCFCVMCLMKSCSKSPMEECQEEASEKTEKESSSSLRGSSSATDKSKSTRSSRKSKSSRKRYFSETDTTGGGTSHSDDNR